MKRILISGVEAKHSEVLKATQATISCVVTGLTKALDAVAWQKPDGAPITDQQDGYEIAEGTYADHKQTTILTVPADADRTDSVFTCVITSNEHRITAAETDVNLNVFSKSFIHSATVEKYSKCTGKSFINPFVDEILKPTMCSETAR